MTGGGFHEFVKQEAIVPPAVARHANVVWTIDHTAGTSTEVLIDRHKDTAWTKEFDVVLYNMSFSHVVDVSVDRTAGARASRQRRRRRDPAWRGPQLPAVTTRAWGELMGAFSMRHDSQRPLDVQTVAPDHPIMRGVPARWVTIPEELYELERVWPA